MDIAQGKAAIDGAFVAHVQVLFSVLCGEGDSPEAVNRFCLGYERAVALHDEMVKRYGEAR